MSHFPIGIFDSGIGGTSIFKEIAALLPHEDIIYLADSKYAPYGNKSKEDILKLSIKNTELLLQKGCKLIVVACNTATTNAIDYLRENYNVPFIGIEPAIKPASLNSKTKAIGILATKGTLSSALFHKTMNLYNDGVTVVERVGEGLVPLIEQGDLQSNDLRALLQVYLKPMVDAKIDYLVLGCTHYPYLIPLIKTIVPKDITIIDSGLAVAKQTKAILEQLNLINSEADSSTIEFFTNGDTKVLRNFVNKHYGVAYLDF